MSKAYKYKNILLSFERKLLRFGCLFVIVTAGNCYKLNIPESPEEDNSPNPPSNKPTVKEDNSGKNKDVNKGPDVNKNTDGNKILGAITTPAIPNTGSLPTIMKDISNAAVTNVGIIKENLSIKVDNVNLTIGKNISGKGSGSNVFEAKYGSDSVIVKTMTGNINETVFHMLYNTVSVGPKILKWFKNSNNEVVVIMEKLYDTVNMKTDSKTTVTKVLSDLNKIHTLGYTHGDISPLNLIGSNLIDFDNRYPTVFYSGNEFKGAKNDLVAVARSLLYQKYASEIKKKCEDMYQTILITPALKTVADSFTFTLSYIKTALIDNNKATLNCEFGIRPQKYFMALMDAYNICGIDPWTGFKTDICAAGDKLDELLINASKGDIIDVATAQTALIKL